MDKYEYKTFRYDTKGLWGGKVETDQFEMALNRFGDDGWKMVSSFTTAQSYGSSRSVICIFKRKKG